LNFKRADFDLFRTLVARVPWESLLKGKGVQEAWMLLKMEILKAQEQAVSECCTVSRRGRRPVWMNRELLLRLQKKKRVHVLWKKGQATWGDYMEVAEVCREEVRKAKARLELRLATAVKEKKKSFYKYTSGKRRSKENLHPVLDAAGNVTTEDREKAEVLTAFFTSAFNSQISYPQGTLCPDLEVWDATQNTRPVIQLETVRELLLPLDCHKSMGPDGFHPGVLKELAGVIAGPLSAIYQHSWLSGEVPEDWSLADVTPIYKKGRKEDPGNYRPVSLTSVPENVMEQIIMGRSHGTCMASRGSGPASTGS